MVVYGIDLLKSLFTNLPGFEMMNDDKFKLYCDEDKKAGVQMTTIIKVGKASWRLLGNHEVVRHRPWSEEMLDKGLLKSLNDVFEDQLAKEADYFMLTKHATWEELLAEYLKEVQTVFDKYIEEGSWDDPVQQSVRDQLDRKLQWLFLSHSLHYAPVLPIMTKSTIVALRNMLKRSESAIREVSFH